MIDFTIPLYNGRTACRFCEEPVGPEGCQDPVCLEAMEQEEGAFNEVLGMAQRKREEGADNDVVYYMIYTYLANNHPEVDAEHFAQLIERLTDPDEEEGE